MAQWGQGIAYELYFYSALMLAVGINGGEYFSFLLLRLLWKCPSSLLVL